MTTFAKLSTTEPKEGKLGMKFVNLTDDNGPHCFKVESPKIIFEPSVYNGTGEEERKNIVMAITEEAAKEIEELENWTRIRVGVSAEKWNSCVKRLNGPQLKAKINMSGQRQCEFAGHNYLPARKVGDGGHTSARSLHAEERGRTDDRRGGTTLRRSREGQPGVLPTDGDVER